MDRRYLTFSPTELRVQDPVNLVEVVGGGGVEVQGEGLRGQDRGDGGGEDPGLRAVAVSDVDVEPGADGGVPGGEAVELRVEVRHLTAAVGPVLPQETDNQLLVFLFEIASSRIPAY